MKADLNNFLNPEAFKTIMTTQLGWFLGEFKVINGLAVVKPDFYDTNLDRKSVVQGKSDWEWTQEKEWVIVKNDNGEWVKTCCVLSDFPFRKQVKC